MHVHCGICAPPEVPSICPHVWHPRLCSQKDRSVCSKTDVTLPRVRASNIRRQCRASHRYEGVRNGFTCILPVLDFEKMGATPPPPLTWDGHKNFSDAKGRKLCSSNYVETFSSNLTKLGLYNRIYLVYLGCHTGWNMCGILGRSQLCTPANSVHA